MPESTYGFAGYAKLNNGYLTVPGHVSYGQDLVVVDRTDDTIRCMLYDGHGNNCVAQEYNYNFISYTGSLLDAFEYASNKQYPYKSGGFVFAAHQQIGHDIEVISVGDVATYVYQNDTLIEQQVHNTSSLPTYAPILSETFDLILADSHLSLDSPLDYHYGIVRPDGSFDLSKTMNSDTHRKHMWDVLSNRGQSLPLWEELDKIRPPNMDDPLIVEEFFIKSVPQMLYLLAKEKDTSILRTLCGPISSMEKTADMKFKPHTELAPLVYNYSVAESPMIIIHVSDGVTDAIDLGKHIPQIILNNCDKPNPAQAISDEILQITIDTLKKYQYINSDDTNTFDDVSILTNIITT